MNAICKIYQPLQLLGTTFLFHEKLFKSTVIANGRRYICTWHPMFSTFNIYHVENIATTFALKLDRTKPLIEIIHTVEASIINATKEL